MSSELNHNHVLSTTTRCVARFYPYKDRVLSNNIVGINEKHFGGELSSDINTSTSLNPIAGGHDAISNDQISSDLPAINGGITNKETNATKSFGGLGIPTSPISNQPPKIGGTDGINGFRPGSSHIGPLPRTGGMSDDNTIRNGNIGVAGYDINNSAMESEEVIEDNDIISCEISKDKLDAADAFSLVLKSTKNWNNIVKPGDWVVIYLDDSSKIDLGGLGGVKIIGQIDRVAQNQVTMMDGSISTSYLIHGSGWGKVLHRSGILYNLYYGDGMSEVIAQTFSMNAMYGTAAFVIEKLLEIFLGNAGRSGNIALDTYLIQLLLPPKLFTFLSSSLGINTNRSKDASPSLYDILNRKIYRNTDDGLMVLQHYSRMISPDLWAVLNQFSNDAINEIFTDTVNGVPTLIFRKQPLTKQIMAEYASENTTIITRSMIINQNLGMSDNEMVTATILSAPAGNGDMATASFIAGDFPLANIDACKRYGLNIIERATEYGWKSENTTDFPLLSKWGAELFYYWTNAYKYETGSIDMAGITDFHLGNFVLISDTNRLYEIHGITYKWTYNSPVYTSLNLIHGVDKNINFVNTVVSKEINTGTSEYKNNDSNVFGNSLLGLKI